MPTPIFSTAVTALGQLRETPPDFDYRSLGLQLTDLDALTEIAIEATLFDEGGWAPYHAIGAFEIFEPAMALPRLIEIIRFGNLEDGAFDAWFDVVHAMGESAKPFMMDLLRDDEAPDQAKEPACEILGNIADQFPVHAAEIYRFLRECLERFETNGKVVNAFLIHELSDHDTAGHALLIEQAYAAGKVDLAWMGTWEQFSKDHGLSTTLDHDRAFDELTDEDLAFLCPEASREEDYANTGRNDACPCGSGKKFKKCHAIPPTYPEERRAQEWVRGMGEAMGELEKACMPALLANATRQRFLLGASAPELPEDTIFLFLTWALFHDRTAESPTSEFEKVLQLQPERFTKHADRLALMAAEPFTFWQVRHVTWKRSVVVRDLLRGIERTINHAAFAGDVMWGDIFFGQILEAEGLGLLSAIGAQLYSPRVKETIRPLREELLQDGPIDAAVLLAQNAKLRRVYFDMLERPLPAGGMANMHGEALTLSELEYELSDPEAALAALQGLSAPDAPTIQRDAAGRLRSAQIPWTAPSQPGEPRGEISLGGISIEGSTLHIFVNSQSRRERILAEISERLGASATLLRDHTMSTEDLLSEAMKKAAR